MIVFPIYEKKCLTSILNMRMFRIFLTFNKLNIRQCFGNFTHIMPTKINRGHNNMIKKLKYHSYRKYSTEHEDESDDYPMLETETLDQTEQAKYLLFKKYEDILIKQLNDCSCIEDIWNTLHKYKGEITENHITQVILVLKDLQNGYCKANCCVDTASSDYLKEVKATVGFSNLMEMIVNRLYKFDYELLSYVFLYLYKLGIHSEEYPMMMIAEKLQGDLLENFNISICSRLIKVIFSESGVRPYYMSLKLIPDILKSLDECDSVEDLANVSTCLSKLQNIVNEDVIKKYIEKVEDFFETRKLKSANHNQILKIVTFLSTPACKDQNVSLISKCMLLLKNEINQLDIPHLLLLYEIFFKNQEPGDLLNEIQRNAAKFWQQFEENGNLDSKTALKLFSALIYFNSPLHRIHLRKDIDKILKDKMSPANLILIRKIFSYVKISDKNLCAKYWRTWSNILLEDGSIHYIVKACQNYMHFNIDIDDYRNYLFERQVLELIKDLIRKGELIFPPDLTVLLTFVMLYGNDETVLEVLLKKLKDNPRQLKGKDCLMISRVLNIHSNSRTEKHYTEIKNILNDASQYLLSVNYNQSETNALLIKSAIARNEYDNYDIDCLMTDFKKIDFMSSKLLENISYIFLSTTTLIPEVFNNITEYIVKNRHNIVGFNAEKILFLCFHLAYIPINSDKFFQAATDIIIRDQERLSGLAFLQSALSLSFFNKLPSFLVKQIFNVEFMDRLDNELANCYSKDKYPQRVRQALMYLNRTVCLEYPEFNIPWFHEKYLQDIQKRYIVNELDYTFTKSIKEHLVEIAGNKLSMNIITPYGYHIDFVLNLNKEKDIVSSNSQSISKRVALLLVRQYAFTRFYTHLRGTYQMKIRHLEIMGYSVSVLKCDDWMNLLYSSERLEYLRKLIWPENVETVNCAAPKG